jgi:hypothetical protein
MYTKKIFPQKINQDRVAYNVFDLQNVFNEDRLSFPVYGEKINSCHFRVILRLTVLKAKIRSQKLETREVR